MTVILFVFLSTLYGNARASEFIVYAIHSGDPYLVAADDPQKRTDIYTFNTKKKATNQVFSDAKADFLLENPYQLVAGKLFGIATQRRPRGTRSFCLLDLQRTGELQVVSEVQSTYVYETAVDAGGSRLAYIGYSPQQRKINILDVENKKVLRQVDISTLNSSGCFDWGLKWEPDQKTISFALVTESDGPCDDAQYTLSEDGAIKRSAYTPPLQRIQVIGNLPNGDHVSVEYGPDARARSLTISGIASDPKKTIEVPSTADRFILSPSRISVAYYDFRNQSQALSGGIRTIDLTTWETQYIPVSHPPFIMAKPPQAHTQYALEHPQPPEPVKQTLDLLGWLEIK